MAAAAADVVVVSTADNLLPVFCSTYSYAVHIVNYFTNISWQIRYL
jgi:hypothetical protein